MLRVLLVDNDQDSSSRIAGFFAELTAWQIELRAVSSHDAGAQAMSTQQFDFCFISDALNADLTSLGRLGQADSRGRKPSIILLTDHNGENAQTEPCKADGVDCLVKRELTPQILEQSIRYGLERRRLETKLQEAERSAEIAIRAKRDFLTIMSHEIRAPLNAVIGMTQLIQETELTSEQREYANVVQSSSEALLSLTQDIVDFSKIESGNLELEEMDFNLRDIVENVAEILSVRALEKGIELLCHVDPAVPESVIGDPARLRQIIVNLARNAIQFTQQGEVSIQVKNSERNRTGAKDATLHFMIADTGIGFSPDDQSRILGDFLDADGDGGASLGPGSLGLGISRTLVEIMGGEMWLESEVGVGSTFHFALPLSRVENGPVNVVAHYPSFGNSRALIVNDNQSNRSFLKRTLAYWGFQVHTAATGAEAVRFIHDSTGRLDLAIIDHQMSDLGGADVVREIKNDPSMEHAKIILLVTWGGLNTLTRHTLQIDEAIMKPVKQSKLLETLIELMHIQKKESNTKPPESAKVIKVRQEVGNRILLADDNGRDQKLVKGILEDAGYELDIVDNGQRAVDATRHRQYDLILMNIVMPVMDGFEATREIRISECRSAGSKVPIIALTSFALEGFPERCYQNDIDDYVSKPIIGINLLATIENWLEARIEAGAVDGANALE